MMTLNEVTNRWLAERTARGDAKTGIDGDASRMTYLGWLGEQPLHAVTSRLIRVRLGQVYGQEDISFESVAGIRANLHTAFEYARSLNLIGVNPVAAVEWPRVNS